MRKGMDPQAVESMAMQMDEAGQGIREVYARIQARVSEFDWTGEDRDQYVSEFDSSVGQLVQQVAQQASDFAERARTNAAEQREASA